MRKKWKTYIPIHWYGLQKNQYHMWLFGNGKDRKGLIRGDFGISYIDSQQISTKIWDKIEFLLVFQLFQFYYIFSEYSHWNLFYISKRFEVR